MSEARPIVRGKRGRGAPPDSGNADGPGRGLLARGVDVLGSFGLAVTLLLLLLVLTFVGTFAQGRMSLYDVQRRYFDSLIAVVDVGPVSIPLPGALTTLALLSVNLIVGGVLRLRRGASTIGVLIAHLGILLLFGGGLVESLASDKGQMTLHEPGGDPAASRSNRFESWTDWELAIGERRADGRRVDHVIPGGRLEALDGTALRATDEGLPFDVVVSSWVRNGRPRRASSPGDGAHGWVIEALDPDREAERNVPMADVRLLSRDGTERGSLVWGLQPVPWATTVGPRTFEVALRHRSWTLPFSLRLDRFIHETHPGTRMDSRFSSYVTKIEDGVERQVHITMNEPLRHRGYTFYQSGWGPADAPEGTPRFSTFSVVRNPSDRVPIAACVVIAAGLLVHFGRRVRLHVRTEAEKRATARGAIPAARRRLAPALVSVLALAAASATAASAAGAGSASGAWTAAALERAATLPLQDGGRVKPLDSHAAFTLLRIAHRRSATDAQGRRIRPLEWMLDVLFRPEAARGYPTFLVEDSQVLDAAGLPHEGKDRRDRYSFAELAPVRGRLEALAREYMPVESKDRTQVENGVVELYGNLEAFDALSHFLDFARAEIALPDAPKVRALWPGRDRVEVLDVLERLDALTALAGTGDPHAGVPGAPAGAPRPADPDSEAAGRVLAGAGDVLQAADGLAVIPPEGTETTWRTPGFLLARAARGDAPDDARSDLVRRWVATTRAAGDPSAFEREVAGLSERSTALARERGEGTKVALEVFLNRLDPFYRALYFYVAAFLVLAVSWLGARRRLMQAAWVLVLSGAALHLTGIVIRSVLRGHPPVSTLYDTTLMISLVTVVGFLVAEGIHRRGTALALAPLVGGILLFVGQRFEVLKGEDTLPQLVAVLDTNFWLASHVTCITIGYAGGLLASAVAHVHVLGRVIGFRRDDRAFYALLSRMGYGMLAFALLFSVVGTILGGIWANESWGRFWGWDPKENGALMICLAQLAILHARMGGLLKAFGVAVTTIGMGCVVAFSWWGVNLLGIGLHSYGFTGGVMRGLTIFYVVEAAVIAAAAATHWTGRSYGSPAVATGAR